MAEDVKRQKKWRATIYDVDPLTGYCSRMHYVEAEKLEELEEMVACEDDSSLIQIQFIPIEDGLHEVRRRTGIVLVGNKHHVIPPNEEV
mgnify:CR=1 FL=1